MMGSSMVGNREENWKAVNFQFSNDTEAITVPGISLYR